MAVSSHTCQDPARTWAHIKALYILCILLSIIVLTLFIVCFMTIIKVQDELTEEITLRKERENRFLHDLVPDRPEPIANNLQAEGSEVVADAVININNDLKISATTLTRFCASIHSHCPLRGPAGPPGMPGLAAKGERGSIGVRGYPGPQGEVGPTGAKGQKGDIGAPGFGIKGEKGHSGAPGEKGNKGENGTTGLKGEQGNTGEAGVAGQGLKGEPGEKGSGGLPGLDGTPGLTGAAGIPGLKGDKGEVGEPGLLGPKGDPGQIGQTGDKGDAGVSGAPGAAGAKGEPGQPGPPGALGERGKRGKPGLDGPRGEKGDPGVCPDEKIARIGKPLLLLKTDFEWGSWMIDTEPTQITKGKYYVTHHFTGGTLNEYSEASLKSGKADAIHNLQDLFYGTGGVFYKGAFYYQRAGFNHIARYDLAVKSITAQLAVEDSLHQGASSLFRTQYNYYDMAVDENGLWLMYAYKPSSAEPPAPNTLVVAKLEPIYLEMIKTWNITVARNNYSNAFIVQGILYLMEDGNQQNTKITFAYDLYSNKELSIAIPFSNVFENNKMLSYYPAKKEIMAWDGGNLVSYPIIADRK